MVRTAHKESDNEKLDRIISETAVSYGYEVLKAGWARTTWEIFKRNPENRNQLRLAIVESFATVNGEIKICDPQAMPFVQALGKRLEQEFPTVKEAVIVEKFE